VILATTNLQQKYYLLDSCLAIIIKNQRLREEVVLRRVDVERVDVERVDVERVVVLPVALLITSRPNDLPRLTMMGVKMLSSTLQKPFDLRPEVFCAFSAGFSAGFSSSAFVAGVDGCCAG
jgi:hypothetical protein